MKYIGFFLSFTAFTFSLFAQPRTSQSCHDDLFAKQAENKFWGYVDLFDEWRVEPVFTKVYPFTGNKAVVEKYGKFGVANCEGKLYLPAEYEEIGPLTFSKSFWAKKLGKWSLVSERGDLMVPGNIVEIKEIGFNSEATWLKLQDETFGLYDKFTRRFLAAPRYTMFQIMSEQASIVQYKEKFGVVSNTDGKYLYEPVITSLKRLNSSVVIFQEKGKWGMMNTKGEVKKIAEMDSIGFILNNLFYASKDGKAGLIDASGKEVLPLVYEEVNPFYDHMSLIKRNGVYGYTTLAGKVTVPLMYEWGDVFQQGQAIVKTSAGYFIVDKNNIKLTVENYKWLVKTPSRGYYAAHRDGKYLFLDLTAKEIITPTFGLVVATDTNQFVRVQDDSTKLWNYFDVTTKDFAIKGGDFEEAKPFANGFAFVKKYGKWGVINQTGTLIVTHKYEQINYLLNGNAVYFLVIEKGKKGVLSATAVTVLPSEYDLITVATDKLWKVKKENKYQVFNLAGEDLSKSKYDYMSNAEETPTIPAWPTIISKKGKFGLLAQNQLEIIEPSFEDISYLGDGLYLSLLKGKKGMLASNGKVLAGNYLDEIRTQSEKYLPCKQGAKWGYLFNNGKMMIVPAYDEAGDFYKNLALVKLEGKWGIINKQGRMVLKNEFDSVSYLPNNKRRLVSATRTIEISEKGIIKQID